MTSNELSDFLIEIGKLRPDLQENIKKIYTSLVHSAPEIWNETYWKSIYILLCKNVQVQVDVNDNNRIIYDKYHKLYEKYKSLNNDK